MDEATGDTPGNAATEAGGPDELCKRRTYSMYEEDLARLARLEKRFGKSASEVFRLGLMAIEGNMRIFRHAQAQPVNALKILAHLIKVKARDPEDVEIAADIAHCVGQLEAMLAPIDPEHPGA